MIKQEITEHILLLINDTINPLDYSDLSEVVGIANTPIEDGEDEIITEWRDEAKGILLWITKLWVLRDTIDDLNVQTLPKYN